MISIYNYNDIKSYIRDHLAGMPKKGYGQAIRLAAHLNVHTTLVSQVLKGSKTFTLEQGALTAEFLGLNEDETEFFLVLLSIERAGNSALKRTLERQKAKIAARANELVNRLKSDTKLSEEQRAVFYSDWVYSASRQCVALPGIFTVDQIADRLRLSKKRARDVVEFLLQTGLIEENGGKLRTGARRTHLESTSPWVRVHHTNWRHKAIGAFSQEEAAKLHYTLPLTISAADALKIREMISKFLENVGGVHADSNPEELRCLNIDWFRVA